MELDPVNLFFQLKGQINRTQFWMGFVGLFVFVVGINALLNSLSGSMTAFYIALIFPFLAVYMIYCVYGKRLQNLNRTRWWITGAIFAQFLAVIAVMLTFGGAEYFADFAQYDRKEDIDPAVTQAIIDRYQARQAENLVTIKIMLLAIPTALTAWIGFAK